MCNFVIRPSEICLNLKFYDSIIRICSFVKFTIGFMYCTTGQGLMDGASYARQREPSIVDVSFARPP
jgi:hypothetical protein